MSTWLGYTQSPFENSNVHHVCLVVEIINDNLDRFSPKLEESDIGQFAVLIQNQSEVKVAGLFKDIDSAFDFSNDKYGVISFVPS